MDILRTLVSGQKKRFRDEKFNLDLAYITPRIIGMAIPASGVESFYRNNIDSVSSFLEKYHAKRYRIFNVAGRKYDYSKFDFMVEDFDWEDHHAPPVALLFQICQKMHYWLSGNDENIVVVHCRAGKGRTGTLICCYMLYSGKFTDPDHALQYYARKRFHKGGGVNQPSQVRYVKYFYQVLRGTYVHLKPKKLVSLALVHPPNLNGGRGYRPFIEVYAVSSKKLILTTAREHQDQHKFWYKDAPNVIHIPDGLNLIGDILIRVFHNRRWSENKKLGRITFNTSLMLGNTLDFPIESIDPYKLKKNSAFPRNYKIRLQFNEFCQHCVDISHSEKKCDRCKKIMFHEIQNWNSIHSILSAYVKPDEATATRLLFGKTREDIDEILTIPVHSCSEGSFEEEDEDDEESHYKLAVPKNHNSDDFDRNSAPGDLQPSYTLTDPSEETKSPQKGLKQDGPHRSSSRFYEETLELNNPEYEELTADNSVGGFSGGVDVVAGRARGRAVGNDADGGGGDGVLGGEGVVLSVDGGVERVGDRIVKYAMEMRELNLATVERKGSAKSIDQGVLGM